MAEMSQSPIISNLYTTYSHHLGLSVVSILQSVFAKGDFSRTISLNTHHFILLSNPRSANEYRLLARQVFPGQSKYFNEALKDALEGKKYSYLQIDASPYGDDKYGRLRTSIFPDDKACVTYIPI